MPPKNANTPPGYRPRLIENRLDALMEAFGCVVLTGPKWCGKTWTALTRAASVTQLDNPSERMAAEMDPSLALVGDTPHLVDEWQEVPEVWDAARHYIDAAAGKRGLLLLTGSTNLSATERDRLHHSGAGRIARLAMHTMSLQESGDSSAQVSLRALLSGEPLEPTSHETELAEVARWCCRGGWPANLGLPDAAAFETASQYIQAALDVNIVDERRSPATALALMRALALNETQATTYKTLARDMSYGDESPTTATIASYLELFSQLKLIEELPGWEPPMRAKARVRTKPKRYFCDPSLAASLLGATPEGLLHDTQTLGLLFENLVVHDLRVYLSTYAGIGNNLYYFRDDKGLEVDVILEYGGRWAAIEVKLSDTKADDGAENLLRLKGQITRNTAAQVAEPLFLAVVVGRGKLAYTREDGVMVIPLSQLGA